MTDWSIVHRFGAWTAWIMGPRAEPGSVKDIARCVWSLGAWLWPIPAGVVGLSLRRLDSDLQQQAVLDGALGRTTFRQLAPAIAASFAMVLVLAMQEFAVYEPTGISVIAVEVRTVFDTGGMLAVQGVNAWTAGGIESAGFSQPQQPARAAAAVVTGAPLVLMVA
jgi:ABC-type Fe3+ transport system permease subunit